MTEIRGSIETSASSASTPRPTEALATSISIADVTSARFVPALKAVKPSTAMHNAIAAVTTSDTSVTPARLFHMSAEMAAAIPTSGTANSTLETPSSTIHATRTAPEMPKPATKPFAPKRSDWVLRPIARHATPSMGYRAITATDSPIPTNHSHPPLGREARCRAGTISVPSDPAALCCPSNIIMNEQTAC